MAARTRARRPRTRPHRSLAPTDCSRAISTDQRSPAAVQSPSGPACPSRRAPRLHPSIGYAHPTDSHPSRRRARCRRDSLRESAPPGVGVLGALGAAASRRDGTAHVATRRAQVAGRSAAGTRERTLETDGAGRWRVDGVLAPQLDGCLDVDLESSCLTNAFPVHRLDLAVGQRAQAPAAYVRALDLTVDRLEQLYVRLDDADGCQRYRYA